jgi:hypothetical protein
MQRGGVLRKLLSQTLISPFERMLGQKLAMYNCTLTDDLRCRPGVKVSSKAFLDITRSDSQVLVHEEEFDDDSEISI